MGNYLHFPLAANIPYKTHQVLKLRLAHAKTESSCCVKMIPAFESTNTFGGERHATTGFKILKGQEGERKIGDKTKRSQEGFFCSVRTSNGQALKT